MRLMSWNINGIRSAIRRGALSPALDQLQPDIIALQETKAERGQAEVDLPQYEEHWCSSELRKGYSGVAVFTRPHPLHTSCGLPQSIEHAYSFASDPYGNPNKEGRILTVSFNDFYLVNVYTPNAKPDLSRLRLRHTQWDPAFLSYVRMLDSEKPVIFCGDLNVAHTPDDLAKPENNEGEHGFTREERAGVDRILEADFVDVFRIDHRGNGFYTWWSHFGNARARNVGWRIDYFFVSKRLVDRVIAADIHPAILGSDHCPVTLDIDINLR